MAHDLPFSSRVEAGMRGRGLTLRGLCRAVGLDPSFFSKVLAGKRSPPSQEAVLRRIAQALGLDAVELIVSAGRIPSEWRALWEDAELFQEIHDRASRGRSVRPARRPAARSASTAASPSALQRLPLPVPVPGRLSEELL